MTLIKTKTCAVGWYDSVGEFSAALNRTEAKHREQHRPSSFNGNTTLADAQAGMLKGNLSEVPAAEKLLDSLLDAPVEFDVPQWELSVAGQMACVPAYLAGHPESMYRRVEVRSERAPVRIYASVCVSGGLSTDQLRQRGTSILALAMRLAEIRPVELHLFADMGNYGGSTAFMPVIRLDTSPLDLCAASYCLTHPGFLRQACFTWAEWASKQTVGKGWDGAWAWNTDPNSAESLRKTRDLLKAGPDDLVIPGGFAHDPMITQPVKWLNDKIAKYVNAVEENA